MQLNLLVDFHKAIADPTRIRILTLLSEGSLHGQALAGKLGLTPPTVTHHVSKLRDIGVIYERRDKNTIYFYLDKTTLERKSKAIVDLVIKGERIDQKEGDIVEAIHDKREKERASVVRNFFTTEGKLKTIPAQRKKKLYVFEHMLVGLIIGKKYTEPEINEYIKKYHDDFATIRREFIVNHYMFRENSIYEMNPKEMWAKIE